MLRLETATVREIDEAMEANLVAHMSWAQSRLAGARVRVTPELVAVDSGLPSDTFNFVCRARLRADAARGIAEALAFFGETGHPFSWWVGPIDEPAGLPGALRAAGLAAADAELGMICALSGETAAGSPPGDLRIVRATEPREVADYASVLSRNWDPPDPLVVEYYRAAAPLMLGPESPFRLYVGYVGDAPVATSELCVAGGVAGLYNIATVREWRRRGYGAAVTARPLADARAEGVGVAVLQASDDGRHLYARMGFRPHGQYTEFQPAR